MDRIPMNIFLHFLNRDTQEIYGITAKDTPQIYAKMQKGLNASVLLCDTDTYCFLPLGFWFESRYTRQLLAASGAFVENGYIRFSAREDTIRDFIEKKRKQYYAFRKTSSAYQDFFDDTVLQQLLALDPALMERQMKIGEYCSKLWYDGHNRLVDDNSGDLVALYSMVKDTAQRIEIAKIVSTAANNPENPFIWKKVRDLIDNLKIRDHRLERGLRIYFEKNYYRVYLEEYHASNLYAFYPIDRGIDFQLAMPATSIANYRWLEGFLRYLQLDWILSMPAGEVARIRQMPAWLFLQKKYIAACNGSSRFDDNVCEILQLSLDRHDIKSAAVEVKKILNEKKGVIILPSKRVADSVSRIDVLIMVATLEEEQAILSNDNWEKAKTSNGYEYFIHQETLRFALARSIEMGRESGATAAQYYISQLQPRFLAMAGFCAGEQGSINLGDVVVPYKIYRYGDNSGKQLSETETLPELHVFHLDSLWKQKVERFGNEWRKTIKLPRPITYESQRYLLLETMVAQSFSADIQTLKSDIRFPDITQIIRKHIQEGWLTLESSKIVATEAGRAYYEKELFIGYDGTYQDPTLKTQVGVLATGDVVQQWDEIFQKLQKKYDRKTCVLDMEGSAIANVAEYNHIPYIIAKGVGDFASNQKAFDNRYIPYSVFSAYRFLIAFFNALEGQERLGQ